MLAAQPASAVLMALAPAGRRLVAAGERGLILLSDDGGVSWRQAEVPVSVSLTAMRFASPLTGWAVGHAGVILHTRDGGVHWVRQLDGLHFSYEAPDKALFDLCFLDERHGFAVGAYGLLLETRDGGASWQPWHASLPHRETRHFYSIRASGNTLYLAGEAGMFYRSRNGGSSFEEIRTPYAGSYFGIVPVERDGLILYGLKGNAYRSDDGGDHWRKIDTGTSAGLTAGIALRDGSVLLASQAGELLRLPAGALRAMALPLPRSYPLSAVAAASDGVFIAAGARGVRRMMRKQGTK